MHDHHHRHQQRAPLAHLDAADHQAADGAELVASPPKEAPCLERFKGGAPCLENNQRKGTPAAELVAVEGQKKLERFGEPAQLPPDVDPDDPATLGAEPPQHPGTASHGSPEPAAPVAPQHPADGADGGPQAHAREAWLDTPEAWRRWLASAQPWRPASEVRRILADVAGAMTRPPCVINPTPPGGVLFIARVGVGVREH